MIQGEPEWDRDRAIWKQLYEILQNRIIAGTYKPRYPIPSHTQLEQEFALSPHTIIKALKKLQENGYIRAEHGVGTFVRPPEDWHVDEG